MDCDQTAMGLPPGTSVVLVVLVKCGCLAGISEMSLIKREWYVCMYVYYYVSCDMYCIIVMKQVAGHMMKNMLYRPHLVG
jgi:hypothetical protein